MYRRGVSRRIVRAVARADEAKRDLPRLLDELADLGLAVRTPADDDWPAERLAALADRGDAPAALYFRGRLPLVGERAVAIVGTRAATPYGRDLARAWA